MKRKLNVLSVPCVSSGYIHSQVLFDPILFFSRVFQTVSELELVHAE